jgi:hypothetical protein
LFVGEILIHDSYFLAANHFFHLTFTLHRKNIAASLIAIVAIVESISNIHHGLYIATVELNARTKAHSTTLMGNRFLASILAAYFTDSETFDAFFFNT